MSFRPINDIVIIERHNTPSTIVIPGQKEHRGRVLEVGPGRWTELENGKRVFHPTSLEPGDEVIFSHRAGMEVTVDGRTMLVMRENDILCVVEDGSVGMTGNWNDEGGEVIATFGVGSAV